MDSSSTPVRAITPNQPGSRGTPRLDQPRPADSREAEIRRLRKAAGDFESLFLAQLLKPMQNSVQKSSESQSFGGGIMLDVASEKLAEGIAHQGGIGLGKVIFESMKRRLMPDSAAVPVPGEPIPLHRQPQPRAINPPRPMSRQGDKTNPH